MRKTLVAFVLAAASLFAHATPPEDLRLYALDCGRLEFDDLGQYHTHGNRAERRMPAFNVDRADTLASMGRIEKLVANLGARVVIQHSVEDFRALPRLPA